MKKMDRRDFFKLSGMGLGAYFLPSQRAITPSTDFSAGSQAETWPLSQSLGRVCVGKVNMRATPSADAPSVGVLYQDAVVEWQREVIGALPAGLLNRRWVETPKGYLYLPSVQPVINKPNQPSTILPNNPTGVGMWAEVTVPYVDLILENPPARSNWFENVQFPRLYCTQVMWVDQVKAGSDGKTYYHVNERYGNPGDLFWAQASAFRPLDEGELTPINPDMTEKRIDVHLPHQTLSCFEGNREVYFCRISSGARFDAEGNPVDKWATPVGPHPIWRKLVSIHMAGGTTGNGWDTPGIAWTSLFSGDGVAIHSTFWHNNFGLPVSHGCVNASPEDAKWVWRWSSPSVKYDPGDLTVEMPGGTIVNIIEG